MFVVGISTLDLILLSKKKKKLWTLFSNSFEKIHDCFKTKSNCYLLYFFFVYLTREKKVLLIQDVFKLHSKANCYIMKA